MVLLNSFHVRKSVETPKWKAHSNLKSFNWPRGALGREVLKSSKTMDSSKDTLILIHILHIFSPVHKSILKERSDGVDVILAHLPNVLEQKGQRLQYTILHIQLRHLKVNDVIRQGGKNEGIKKIGICSLPQIWYEKLKSSSRSGSRFKTRFQIQYLPSNYRNPFLL